MAYVRKTVSITPQAYRVIEDYAKVRGISFSSALSCIVYDVTGGKSRKMASAKKVTPAP